VAGMAGRETRDRDVPGLKCLRKIRLLLSRLRKVGTACDRAAHRRLCMELRLLFSVAQGSNLCESARWTGTG
jgi:hypothetical protein